MRVGVNYRSLILGQDEAGLYVSSPWLFRIAHPPLYIPWSDIRTDFSPEFLILDAPTLFFGRKQIPFTIHLELAQQVLGANMNRVNHDKQI